MGLQDVPRCQHIKVNGVQCGSPALRRKARCFFHERAHFERKASETKQNTSRPIFGFPLLEDANSIQVAIMKTIQMLGSGELDHRSAGLMLYGLQVASANLRLVRFEPEKPTDVVIDEDTVDLTRLEGTQWSARDFTQPDPAEEEKEGEKIEAPNPTAQPAIPPTLISADPLTARAEANITSEGNCEIVERDEAPAATSQEELADIAKRREQKRKAPLRAQEDGEPDTLAKILLERLGIDWRDGHEEIKADIASRS